MDSVYILPGLFGSSLRDENKVVWGNSNGQIFWETLKTGLDAIAYKGNADKLSPFAANVSYLAQRDKIAELLPAGFAVYTRPYDWRLLPHQCADSIFDSMDGDRIWIVAHSYGCLVAHAIYQKLAEAGQAGRLRGMFFCAGPFHPQGNWSAVEALAARGTTCGRLTVATCVRNMNFAPLIGFPVLLASIWSQSRACRESMLKVCGTMPSLSCLMPIDIPNGQLASIHMREVNNQLEVDSSINLEGSIDFSDASKMREAFGNHYITQEWVSLGRQTRRQLLEKEIDTEKLYEFYTDDISSLRYLRIVRGLFDSTIRQTSDGTVHVWENWGDCQRTILKRLGHNDMPESDIVNKSIASMIAGDFFARASGENLTLPQANTQRLEQPEQLLIPPVDFFNQRGAQQATNPANSSPRLVTNPTPTTPAPSDRNIDP